MLSKPQLSNFFRIRSSFFANSDSQGFLATLMTPLAKTQNPPSPLILKNGNKVWGVSYFKPEGGGGASPLNQT